MEAQRLDDLARKIGSQLPRRRVLGALGGLAALLALPALDGEARKKKHRKPKRGKKKCKGNKKKCGKKCISPDTCCTTADCGKRGECVGGACVCPAGKKSCNGGCIPNDACCQNGDCGPAQTCANGTCACPGNLTKCGTDCIESGLCCPNGDCPAGQTCEGSACWCNAADGIWCDAECCDTGKDETCARSETGAACAGGGCQLFDWCNVVSDSVCRDSPDGYCVCITSYGPLAEVPACVDGLAIGESCATCETNDECGAGYVCVQGDTGESDICGCSGKFCARLCDAEPERELRRASASARNAGHMEKAGRVQARRSR